jgi:hypothetical protein
LIEPEAGEKYMFRAQMMREVFEKNSDAPEDFLKQVGYFEDIAKGEERKGAVQNAIAAAKGEIDAR